MKDICCYYNEELFQFDVYITDCKQRYKTCFKSHCKNNTSSHKNVL